MTYHPNHSPHLHPISFSSSLAFVNLSVHNQNSLSWKFSICSRQSWHHTQPNRAPARDFQECLNWPSRDSIVYSIRTHNSTRFLDFFFEASASLTQTQRQEVAWSAPHWITDSIDDPTRPTEIVPQICKYKAPDLNTKKMRDENSQRVFFTSTKRAVPLLIVGRRKQRKKFHSFAMTSFPLFINLRLSFGFTFFTSVAFLRPGNQRWAIDCKPLRTDSAFDPK